MIHNAGASRTRIGALAVGVALLFVPSVYCDVLKVGDAEGRKAAITKPAPDYPPMAKQMRVSGKVEVDAAVNEEGTVEKVDVASGNTILGSACIATVKKWKFKPFTAEGKPSRALVRLTFTFTP